MFNKYEPIIGLEVHIQIKTNRKAFSPENYKYGVRANSLLSPVTLAHPGTMPILNSELVLKAISMGLALNCTINKYIAFSRKHYFYYDLPKGYQITQYEEPIAKSGFLSIEFDNNKTKKINISKIIIEEDSGKTIYSENNDALIDYNRAGAALLEIVSEPDFSSAIEAQAYLNQLKQIVEYLGLSDGKMEEGGLRCDANISVSNDENKLGNKVEVKNLNSFKNVFNAIEYEIKRQQNVINKGETVAVETRMWDENTRVTSSLRSKEELEDYRYMPEPDLPPIKIEEDLIGYVISNMPELPMNKQARFQEYYKLSKYDSEILTQNIERADFFEKCCKELEHKTNDNYKQIANIINTEILRITKELSLSTSELNSKYLAEIAELYSADLISSSSIKPLIKNSLLKNNSPKLYANENKILINSDSEFIEKIVNRVINENAKSVEKYLSGRTNVFGFLVGEVIKQSKGEANPKIVAELVKIKLENYV